MSGVSDSRVNQLLEFAASRMGIDVRTCPEVSLRKIPITLMAMKANGAIKYTPEEFSAVKAELAAFN